MCAMDNDINVFTLTNPLFKAMPIYTSFKCNAEAHIQNHIFTGYPNLVHLMKEVVTISFRNLRCMYNFISMKFTLLFCSKSSVIIVSTIVRYRGAFTMTQAYIYIRVPQMYYKMQIPTLLK